MSGLRRKSWAVVRAARADTFPPGPQTEKELQEWPLSVARSLFQSGKREDEEMKHRFMTHLLRRATMYSEYPGFDCQRAALELGLEAIFMENSWSMELPLTVHHTCDFGVVQSSVLTRASHEIDGSKVCHFKDILSRIGPMEQVWIAAALPSEHATLEVQKEAYAAIGLWLKENRKWVFPENATDHCEVHNKRCCLNPCAVQQFGRGSKRKLAECDAGMDGDACDAIDTDEAAEVNARPLVIEVAGVTCAGWSSEGSSEGLPRESEVPHAVWRTERQHLAEKQVEDMFLLECTPAYPISKLREDITDTHTVLSLVDGPQYHGHPHKRRRLSAAGLNDATMKWVGPRDYQADFQDRFGKATMLAGTAYLAALQAGVDIEYAKLAEKQRTLIKPEEMKHIDKTELLRMVAPPGGVRRNREWEDWHAASKEICSLSGGFLADIDHHPSRGSSGGSDWPTMTKHGATAHFGGGRDDWRIALGLEHISALGFNMYPEPGCAFPRTKLHPILSSLSPGQQKLLAGNGMHLITECPWMMCVLCNIVRIDRPTSMCRSLPDKCWDEDDFAEDKRAILRVKYLVMSTLRA
jgi:hypothetical protein